MIELFYYLFDGHGDVRALINDAGRITDKYGYNAYGELIERSGETENHYLYTGEYYDGTSNLYYLRARYMSPSTGTFISMDTYEGSIYDPDTLHKYLYANGNPVKYSDPSGNSAVVAMAGMAINDCITTAYNVHLMGVLAGLSNMAVNSILGKQGVGLVTDFFEGYQSGVRTAGILYLTAAISVKAFMVMSFFMATESVIMSVVLLIASVREHNTKASLVYGALLVLAVFEVALTFKLSCEVMIVGDKGSANVVYDCSAGGSKTKTFYTVQSSDDATRLLNGGTPWPTEANRSNLGEGVYAWSTKEDALNYYNLIKQRNDDVEILEFEINVSDLDNMSALDLTRLTDDEVNLFLDSHAKLNGQTPSHGYDYIQRNTGMGVENFFSGKVFSSIKFKK